MGPKAREALPAKEAALFRQIVRFYEMKQYKKGLKAADQILKCVPGGTPHPRAALRRRAPPRPPASLPPSSGPPLPPQTTSEPKGQAPLPQLSRPTPRCVGGRGH